MTIGVRSALGGRGRRVLGFFGPAVLIASLPISALAQTALTVTRTATSTITANMLVEEGASGNIVTANNGNCTGVALNTGTTVQVVEYGTAVVIVNTTTPVVGDLVTCVAGTLGYGTDSGVIPVSGVALGVQIVGRIISVGTAGASTTPVTVQLFGPGVAGTGWLPLVNGFYQFPGTSPGSPTNYTDAYTYKMCAPNTGMPPSLCTPPFVPSTGPSSSYAGFWIDRGGFGTVAGTTKVAPFDYELLRLSAVTQTATRENTLEVFDATTGGLGSVPITAFNEAYTPSNSVLMYGANLHVSGCEGTKCGAGQVDHDIGKIGLEIDIEDRSPSPRGSASDIGLYLAMLNSLHSQNYAIVIGANTAAGVTSVPWGTGLFISGTGGTPQTPGTITGIEVGPGGASTAIKIDELATTGPSNSQPLSLCAYKTSSLSSEVCTNLATTSSQNFVIASPGATQISSTYGLQAVHYVGSQPIVTFTKGGAVVAPSSTVSVAGNDFSGTVSVTTTTIVPGIITTLTFVNGYNNSVNCLVSQNGGGTMSQVGVSHAQTLSTLTIAASAAGASANYSFDYFCSGS